MRLRLESHPLQHAHRWLIVSHAPGPDAVEQATFEAELDDCLRRLCRVTLAPVRGIEVVANLAFGRRVRLPVIDQAALTNANAANELTRVLQAYSQLKVNSGISSLRAHEAL